MNAKQMRRIGWIAGFGLLAHSAALACVTQIPEPEPEEPEHEIWVLPEGIDPATGHWVYMIGVEIELFQSNTTMQCQCGLNVGNPQYPSSLNISAPIIAVSDDSHELREVPEFENEMEWENEMELEDEIESNEDSVDDANATVWVREIDSLDPPEMEPGDVEKLLFRIDFAPEDFDSVVSSQIQFAAGSNDPSHPLQLFSGYQTTLQMARLDALPCPADINADGVVDLTDLTRLLASWGPSSGISGLIATPLTQVDATDLAVLLTSWGPCE